MDPIDSQSAFSAGEDAAVRDKAVRLFTYLKELTELRSEVKRNRDEYEQVVWWAEIPRENECYCAFWDLGREGAYEDWIRIQRPRRKRPPVPLSSLAPWLSEREIADSSLETPTLRETIVEDLSPDGADSSNGQETVVRKLEEYPTITRQWELYVENHWWPWALEDRRLQTVQAIYNDLFAAYQTQERLGEAFEIVVGVGLLTWKPPQGPQVRRHVVAGQVTIEFDSKTGSIAVTPAAEGIRLTLEQEMLEPQDRPLPEIQNHLQQRLTEIGDDVWTGPELTNVLREYFQQLSPSNSLETSIEPADDKVDQREPQMALSPALLVRKRTERSMVRIFQEIAKQLQEGSAIPLGVEKLVAIRDDQATTSDIPMWDALGVDNSFFDQAQIRFSGRVRLREHFRCMPEIIQFSNRLCYEAEPLIPLRQYGAGRLEPVATRYIQDGYVKGSGDRIVNPPEAEAIVKQIEKCLDDPAYDGKRFGVICLQGNAQWNLIRDLLLEGVGAQKLQQRGLAGGNAYAFQGDERHVIFLSMVAAPTDGRHIGVLSKESDKRRFNVAASRAQDQMWLFHSVTLEELSTHCFRRKLLEHCLNPTVQQENIEGIEIAQLRRQAYEADRSSTRQPAPFDSWFEVDVFLRIADRGFRVIPQFPLAGKYIDLLVEGMQGRLNIPRQSRGDYGVSRSKRLCGVANAAPVDCAT